MIKTFTPLLIFIGSLLVANNVIAQSAVLPAGGNATGTAGKVSFSIGQTDYINFANTNNAISLGVQQPKEFFTVSVNKLLQTTINFKVYPNPTSNNCNLNVESFTQQKYHYQLYDISGKLILTNSITEGENSIPMENLASALYLLKVVENTTIVQTFKIIKN